MRKKHSVIRLAAVVGLLVMTSCSRGEAGASKTATQQPLFVAEPPIDIASGPSDVVLGDMNRDGRLDLVASSGQARSIMVLLDESPAGGAVKGGDKNNGPFRASAARTTSVPDIPGEMALGDVNGDGNLDLAFVSHDSYNVTLLLGDDKGGLALAPNSPIVMKQGQHPHTHGLGIGDLNGDGKLDIVTVNNSDNDVSVAFGDGHGGFVRAPGSPFAVGPSPYPLALGDVNSDGHLDIVATASATGPARAQQLPLSRALTLLLGDGHGGFRTSQVPMRTGEPWFVAIGDVNGDRKPDLVVTHHEQRELTVLLGDGAGRFREAGGSPFDLGHNAWQIVLADVNRDRRTDVIAAAGDGVRVMLGDGSGGFKPAPDSPFATGRGTWRLAVGDVNRDGKFDVVTCNSESKTLTVLLGL
jgi:FG-GAP-like repeat